MPSHLPLDEAAEVIKSIVYGRRTWAYVGTPYEDVPDGEVTLVTADGWVVCLHRSYDELKHTHHMLAPDGRHGEEAVWKPEAYAAGRLWGDPLDLLSPHEWDYLIELALHAPPRNAPG